MLHAIISMKTILFFIILFFILYIIFFFYPLFFGAKKRSKRNIHPNPSFPYMGRLNRSYSSLVH